MWRTSTILWVAILLTFTARVAYGDLNSLFTYSLEWLVDSSDVVVVAVVADDGATYRLDRVLRCTSQDASAWPIQGIDDLLVSDSSESKLAKDTRILLFARFVSGKDPPRAFYRIALQEPRSVPNESEHRAKFYRQHLPWVDDPQARLRFGAECIVIDKHGRIFTDPAEALKRVEDRVKIDHKLPPGCDAVLAEKPYGKPRCADYIWIGANWLTDDAELLDSDDLSFSVLVPCDSHLKQRCLNAISGNGDLFWGIHVARGFRRDPDLVAALKRSLRHHDERVRRKAVVALRELGVPEAQEEK